MHEKSMEMVKNIRENERIEQEQIYLNWDRHIVNYYKNVIANDEVEMRIKKFIIEAIKESSNSDEFYPTYTDYALATFLETKILYKLILKHKLKNILVFKKYRIVVQTKFINN